MLDTVLQILSLATLGVSSYILLSSFREKSTLKYLGASFFLVSLFFVVKIFLYQAKILLAFPHFLMFLSPLMFLMAPFFYIGVKGMITNQDGLTRKDTLHFLPAILHALDLIPLYLKSASEKRVVIEHIMKYEEELMISAHGLIPMIWIDIFRFLLMGFYFFKSWMMIHKAGLIQQYLISDRIYSWFKASLIYFGVFQLIFFIVYFFNIQYYFSGVFFPMVRNVSTLILSITVFIYVFEVLRKARLTLGFQEFENKDASVTPIKKGLLLKSMLDRGDQLSKVLEKSSSGLDQLKANLIDLFEVELIFKEKDLTAADLAKRLKISVRHLPAILHQVYGKNFKDLVNHYRNQLAKEKIEKGYLEAFTLESLADEVGYNSRITFFNAFKKEFQVSPTALLNKKRDSQ
jgi:AraC-like DNA-binding protein